MKRLIHSGILYSAIMYSLVGLPAGTEAAAPYVGMPEAELRKELGHPRGEASGGGVKMLTYSGGVIEVKDGVVSNVPGNFKSRTVSAKREKTYAAKQKAYAAKQEAKGLVLFRGAWVKTNVRDKQLAVDAEMRRQREARSVPQPATRPKTKTGINSGSQYIVNRDGHAQDIAKLTRQNKVTIIDFYADWCVACRQISPGLVKLAQSHPDVVLRKINIVNWNSPIAKQYKLTSIPSVWVYDKNRRRIGPPTGSLGLVETRVRDALVEKK